MTTLHIFGDADSCLAIPVRVSTSAAAQGAEKLWANLSIDKPADFLRLIGRRLHEALRMDEPCRESAQHVIEAARLLLDDGELAECEFRLEMFDWHVPNTVTTFSRSPMPS